MPSSITPTKSPVRSPLGLLTAVLVACAITSSAADAVRFSAKPNTSKVKIEGTSTVHDWTMESTIISGFLEVPAGVTLDPAQAAPPGLKGQVPLKVDVAIPVRTMKSSHEGMDEVYQQAMNAPVHPRIFYHLTEMTFKEPHAAGAPLEFDTKGDLVVNGVTNKISMPVRIEAPEKSKLKIIGTIPLKMTDYKVKPPVLAGILKTGDDVKISIEWLVVQK